MELLKRYRTLLDRLVLVVDSVAGKLTHMENRLLKLESDAGAHRPVDTEEPIFRGV